MSAPKQKKSEGKQAQTMYAASAVQLGPPFAGQGPLPAGGWSKFIRPPTVEPGFWSAVRHYPSSGGLVVQLGAKAGTGAAQASLYIGYEYAFTAPATGFHTFRSTLNLGPITRLARGGFVQTIAALQVFDAQGQQVFDLRDDLYANSSTTLIVTRELQGGQRYLIRLGVAPFIQNAGNLTYCEIIAGSAVLEMRSPYGPASAQNIGLGAAGGDDLIRGLLDPRGKHKTEAVSIEDAVKMIGEPILQR
jgi:hypothetical protein